MVLGGKTNNEKKERKSVENSIRYFEEVFDLDISYSKVGRITQKILKSPPEGTDEKSISWFES